jgi:hypothetical protein
VLKWSCLRDLTMIFNRKSHHTVCSTHLRICN